MISGLFFASVSGKPSDHTIVLYIARVSSCRYLTRLNNQTVPIMVANAVWKRALCAVRVLHVTASDAWVGIGQSRLRQAAGSS
jgi:hypothetical protein